MEHAFDRLAVLTLPLHELHAAERKARQLRAHVRQLLRRETAGRGEGSHEDLRHPVRRPGREGHRPAVGSQAGVIEIEGVRRGDARDGFRSRIEAEEVGARLLRGAEVDPVPSPLHQTGVLVEVRRQIGDVAAARGRTLPDLLQPHRRDVVIGVEVIGLPERAVGREARRRIGPGEGHDLLHGAITVAADTGADTDADDIEVGAAAVREERIARRGKGDGRAIRRPVEALHVQFRIRDHRRRLRRHLALCHRLGDVDAPQLIL